MERLPFITFEGTEGSGKSTQVKRLVARLEKSGVPYVLTREPGGTPIGETIKDLLQFASHNAAMTAETELLLFGASRSQLVRETIKPALAQGSCVISDRFFDSTTVYQGAARKLDPEFVAHLNAFAVGADPHLNPLSAPPGREPGPRRTQSAGDVSARGCIPDITFVLDLDAKTAHARMQQTKRRPDRMEKEPIEFYERVRQGYREIAKREPDRVVLIDATLSPDRIEGGIWETLCARFPNLERTE